MVESNHRTGVDVNSELFYATEQIKLWNKKPDCPQQIESLRSALQRAADAAYNHGKEIEVCSRGVDDSP